MAKKRWEGREPAEWPSRDPDSPKYKDDPGYRWYGGVWRKAECIERHRERMREWYWNLSGVEYNHLLLKRRRYQALGRMAKRNERRS